MADKKAGPKDEELLTVLLERKVLSNAQVEVAKIDSVSSGLSYADVLLARKWITEEVLTEFYPAAGQKKTRETTQEQANEGGKAEATYEDNLQKYKQLMNKIMGGSY